MTTLGYILSEIDNAVVNYNVEYPEIWLPLPVEIGLPIAQQRLSADYDVDNYKEREVYIHIVYYGDSTSVYEVTIWDNGGNEEVLFTDKTVFPLQEKIVGKFQSKEKGET